MHTVMSTKASQGVEAPQIFGAVICYDHEIDFPFLSLTYLMRTVYHTSGLSYDGTMGARCNKLIVTYGTSTRGEIRVIRVLPRTGTIVLLD